MAAKTRSWLMKKRTWLGAAVAAGVLIGINFPEFWKGFGGGGGSLFGTNGQQGEGDESSETAAHIAQVSIKKTGTDDPSPTDIPDVVRVIIAERSFALVDDEGDEQPASLREVIGLVKRAPGDEDGIKLKIYRKPSSRPSAETALHEALADASIGEESVLWVPAASE